MSCTQAHVYMTSNVHVLMAMDVSVSIVAGHVLCMVPTWECPQSCGHLTLGTHTTRLHPCLHTVIALGHAIPHQGNNFQLQPSCWIPPTPPLISSVSHE